MTRFTISMPLYIDGVRRGDPIIVGYGGDHPDTVLDKLLASHTSIPPHLSAKEREQVERGWPKDRINDPTDWIIGTVARVRSGRPVAVRTLDGQRRDIGDACHYRYATASRSRTRRSHSHSRRRHRPTPWPKTCSTSTPSQAPAPTPRSTRRTTPKWRSTDEHTPSTPRVADAAGPAASHRRDMDLHPGRQRRHVRAGLVAVARRPDLAAGGPVHRPDPDARRCAARAKRGVLRLAHRIRPAVPDRRDRRDRRRLLRRPARRAPPRRLPGALPTAAGRRRLGGRAGRPATVGQDILIEKMRRAIDFVRAAIAERDAGADQPITAADLQAAREETAATSEQRHCGHPSRPADPQ